MSGCSTRALARWLPAGCGGEAPLSFAAGDRNAFPGHPGGLVGGKKERHAGNVVGPAEPPHRELETHPFRTLGGDAELSQAFGLGRAGGDGVDPNALAGELNSERARDSVDRALRGGIDQRIRHRIRGPYRAEVDDAAARAVESLDGLLRSEDRAEDVGVELAMEILLGHRLERVHSVHARVVDQDIWPAE